MTVSLWQRLATVLRRQRWRAHLGTLLTVLAVLVGAHLWQTRHVPPGPVPNLPLVLTTGETTTLHAWRAQHPGQPVALHVWAEWCPICRTEEHSITRLHQDWPVLTLAMQSGGLQPVQKVLERRQLPWNTAIDSQGSLARSLGVQSVPALLVLDANGHIRAASVGYTSEIGMRLRMLWVRVVQ